MFDPKPLHDAILSGQAGLARTLVGQLLAAGVSAVDVVDRAMVPAMEQVGRRFENCEYFVPELLISARAMKGALDVLRPELATRGGDPTGRVVIGTVRGDLHDIGKTLVSSMLEGAGFDVVDLGVDVAPDSFVDAVKRHEAPLMAMSAMLTTTMAAMKTVIIALERAGLRERVKVMVGGAPITERYADEIGADGYAVTAAAAVHVARRLLSL
jgi:5-methyltetrahydrofolate--homocysteine methyltransferase